MEIYTSYFAKAKELINAGITPISIAIGPPRWWNGLRYTALAPTWDMVKGDIGRERYIKEYNDILAKLDACAVLMEINSLAKGNDCALLCWEKPSDFCHRHLAAEWLNDNAGCFISEYKSNMKTVKHELSLF